MEPKRKLMGPVGATCLAYKLPQYMVDVCGMQTLTSGANLSLLGQRPEAFRNALGLPELSSLQLIFMQLHLAPVRHSHSTKQRSMAQEPTIACARWQVGIHTVIDCATARPEESAQRVDWEGKVALIQCAQARLPAAMLMGFRF